MRWWHELHATTYFHPLPLWAVDFAEAGFDNELEGNKGAYDVVASVHLQFVRRG